MNAALLLVDLQHDYLAAPGLQPAAPVLVARAAALLGECRGRGIPVVHVWTTVRRHPDTRLPHWRIADRWSCVEDTRGHAPPGPLQPLEGEAVVHKTGFNSFADGSLDETLRRTACDTVIVAGLHLHACIRTVAVECLERGYQVYLAEDAVASNDLIHAAAIQRWLSERCVVCEPTASVLRRLDGVVPGSYVHRSPRRTDEILFEVTPAGAGEVASAVSAAQNAADVWRRTPMEARQNLLVAVADRLDGMASTLAEQMAVELGKPLRHGLEEVRRAAANIRHVVRLAASQAPHRQELAGLVRYRPMGVVAIISPWNNPLAIALGKIAPALIYGNTVVWKPAPAATRIAQAILRLLSDVGMSPQVVSLVTGDHTTAKRLAGQTGIDAVTLTGSAPAGTAMQEVCARRMVPLQAELSGNNAAIVWDDADLRDAARQVAWGAFAFAGQRCTANRRLIVAATQYERILHELEAAANQLPWGDPCDEATEIGPVISAAKRDEIAAMMEEYRDRDDANRTILLHGCRAQEPWVKTGAYVRPAIVCCDRADHPLVQEETMGPVLVVQRAVDFKQAIGLCNGVRHGLVSALFSTSPRLQGLFLESAQAGVLKINTSTAGVDASMPFGGWKASGIGPPEHGEGDRLFYTRIQAVYGNVEGRFDSWERRCDHE